MKTLKEIYNESYQTGILNAAGYTYPQKGNDGHITFTKDAHRQILIDLPGNEWHYMFDGVVKTVGKMDDKSLGKFFFPHIREEKENKKKKREDLSDILPKQHITEPEGGNQGGSSSGGPG